MLLIQSLASHGKNKHLLMMKRGESEQLGESGDRKETPVLLQPRPSTLSLPGRRSLHLTQGHKSWSQTSCSGVRILLSRSLTLAPRPREVALSGDLCVCRSRDGRTTGRGREESFLFLLHPMAMCVPDDSPCLLTSPDSLID